MLVIDMFRRLYCVPISCVNKGLLLLLQNRIFWLNLATSAGTFRGFLSDFYQYLWRGVSKPTFSLWETSTVKSTRSPTIFSKSSITRSLNWSNFSSTHLRWLFLRQYSWWWILQWPSLASHNTFTCIFQTKHCLNRFVRDGHLNG